MRSFLKDVQELDTRRAKALLQTILSAAHVYRDGRIELEFRGSELARSAEHTVHPASAGVPN